MGTATIDDSSQKELNADLLDVGNKLLMLGFSSTDELLMLLEKAQSSLAKVWQQPPKSTAKSLLPVMKALITDELLKHADMNVQTAVANCMNELTRITAPDTPYPDKIMKIIFQLFMVSMKQLSSTSNFDEPLRILEYMAKVRTCLLMMDIVSDEMIVEMFQLFLNAIRSDHPPDIFNYMQLIMTMVIKESDEISIDLLKPLLASVRKDNKIRAPISWMLANNVMEKSIPKLARYVREAVTKLKLSIDDYADIVMSLCQEASNGKKKMDSTSKSTNTKKRKKSAPEKEKVNRVFHADNEDKLVNSRIQVWWPMDEVFYPGTVTAFDPATNKHTIRYDDDEIEKLDLKNEMWKPLSDETNSKPESQC